MSIAATRHASGPRNDRSQSVAPRAGRLSSAYLAGVCAVVLGSALLPVPASVDGLTRSLVGVSVVVAVLVGVRTYRPRTRLPWYLIAAGQAMWVLADTIAPRHDDALRIGTFPSAADLLCLAGYPTFAAALALLVRHRNRSRRDPGPVLDSAVVTAGLCLLSWVLLVRPTIEANHSIGTALVAAAYPMMGIVLVGGLVRLVSARVAGRRRSGCCSSRWCCSSAPTRSPSRSTSTPPPRQRPSTSCGCCPPRPGALQPSTPRWAS